MDRLSNIWNQVEVVLHANEPDLFTELYQKLMIQGDTGKHDQHEAYYAAGYIAYMHPDGKNNKLVRNLSEKAFLSSLLLSPAFLPSVLYLAFIKMDEMKYVNALELLCSCNVDYDIFEKQIVDRFFESKIFCLIELELWSHALRELVWFDNRLIEDSHVGLALINFMKIADKYEPMNEVQKNVLKKIRAILDY